MGIEQGEDFLDQRRVIVREFRNESLTRRDLQLESPVEDFAHAAISVVRHGTARIARPAVARQAGPASRRIERGVDARGSRFVNSALAFDPLVGAACMRSIARCFVLFLLATPAVAQRPGRAFTPADWYKVTTVASPAISPDGRLVAFTVTTVREAENRRHSEVWVVPAAGGDPVRYTSPSTESSAPRWSHDGRYLFFTSNRPGGRGNTWVLRMDQPGGEAYQISDYPTGSMPLDHRFAISTAPPDGRTDEDTEQGQRGTANDPFASMQPAARPPWGAITRPLDAQRFDGRHYTEFPIKANGRGFLANPREARRYRPAQLWLQMVGDTARKRLTNTAYTHGNAVVSPDGRWVAFITDPRLRSDSVVLAERDSLARLPYDRVRNEAPTNESDIFIVSIDGGTPRRLTTGNGAEINLAWSTDSKRVAYVNRATRTANAKLWIVDATGGEPRDLLGNWQYEPGDFQWMPSGELLLNAEIGGRTALFRVDSRTGRMTEVLGGRRRINGTSADSRFTSVAFVATSVPRATELPKSRSPKPSASRTHPSADSKSKPGS
jgi:Tol biopolymer transport system component